LLITRHSGQRAYGIEIRADGKNRECDDIVCAHCGHVDEVPPGHDPADVGARCTCCDKFICFNCRGKGCMPLEMRLDQWERYNDGRKYLRKDRLFEIFRAAGGR
jgi:hypothetical protein